MMNDFNVNIVPDHCVNVFIYKNITIESCKIITFNFKVPYCTSGACIIGSLNSDKKYSEIILTHIIPKDGGVEIEVKNLSDEDFAGCLKFLLEFYVEEEDV